jgi:hypothetical protein
MAWSTTSCEQFPVHKQVKRQQIHVHNKGIYENTNRKRPYTSIRHSHVSTEIKIKLQNHTAKVNPCHSPNLKIQFLSARDAYSAVVYFPKTNAGSGGSTAHSARSYVTETALGTSGMFI